MTLRERKKCKSYSGSLGGWRKISGIDYADSSEIPRRSRRLVWRAAVEMSKNASQLAFQVCSYLIFLLLSLPTFLLI